MRPPKTTFPPFAPAKPRQFSSATEDLVSVAPLFPGSSLPLVYRPKTKDLAFMDWLRDHRHQINRDLLQAGAILFRGFPIATPLVFQDFASGICPGLFRQYGDLPRENDVIYKVTPYPHEDTILFHNESSHMGSWPMKQFFYCHVPAQAGGETPIVDCRQIYRSLAPEWVTRFETLGLKYTRNFIPGLDVRWEDFFRTENREKVEEHCRLNGWAFRWKSGGQLSIQQHSPAVAAHPVTGEKVFFNQIQLHHIAFLKPHIRLSLLEMVREENLPRNVYLGDGSPLPDDLVLGIEKLYWDHAVDFSWQAGDVLLVDNMLIAHGRKPYQPPRKMNVAMGEMRHQKIPEGVSP